jgi:multiple sugar transport system substrate-binding protein
VVPLDGVLGDAASDFNASLIKWMTYQGKLYGVPQVIDTQLLVYRRACWSTRCCGRSESHPWPGC